MQRYVHSERLEGWQGQIALCLLAAALSLSACTATAQSSSPSSLSWIPGWSQIRLKMQQARAEKLQVDAEQPAATFIVKLRDEPRFTMISKTFRRDGVAARKVFDGWCDDHPQFDGLTLESASYSGELVIGLPARDARTASDVLTAFRALDNLVYAELDVMAHPSKREVQ